jgi:hypothetical protein
VRGRASVVAALLLAAAGVAALPAFDDAAAWRVVGLGSKPPTQFAAVMLDGAPALRVEADRSYGNLVHTLPPHTAASGVLRWQWRLDQGNAAADLARRDRSDTALKVCALYDLPLDRVPLMERALLRAGRSVTGEALPAAAVCYVWDARLAPGTTLDDAHSRRVRYVVLRGPEAPPGRWQDEQRELAADFRRMFGDESPNAVPPLAALAIGADADNTVGHSVGHVRSLEWLR